LDFIKAFVRLGHGKNEISLRTDNCLIKIVLYRYLINQDFYPFYIQSAKNEKQNESSDFKIDKKMLRVLYIICKDDPTNGEFQSIETSQNKLKNALNRISLGVELLQVFLSEAIFKKFKTRKTFALKKDFSSNESDLACESYYTKLELNKALAMKENEIFLYLANEIKQDQNLFDKDTKYLAILSFTRYKFDSDTKSSYSGYCALGDSSFLREFLSYF
jgi:hypothetical protein